MSVTSPAAIAASRHDCVRPGTCSGKAAASFCISNMAAISMVMPEVMLRIRYAGNGSHLGVLPAYNPAPRTSVSSSQYSIPDNSIATGNVNSHAAASWISVRR